MKKIYSIFFSMCLLSTNLCTLTAQEKTSVESLVFYDLTSERLNASYTDSKDNTISFSTNEPTNSRNGEFIYRADIDNPLICFGETPSQPPVNAQYTKIMIQGVAGTRPHLYPYLLISLGTDNTLTKLKISGYGSSATPGRVSQLICAFSKSDDSDDAFNNEMGVGLNFPSQTCSVLEVDIPEGTTYLKLISNDFYGNVSVGSFEIPAMIYAMKFYAEAGTTTGIENNSNSSFNVYTQDNNLVVSEEANINIYSMTGVKVLQELNKNSVDISALNKGIYIAKVQSVDKTKNKVIKFIVR